jgi:hypothetical protein
MVELNPREKYMVVQLCIGKASIAGANRNSQRENGKDAEASQWEERRKFRKSIADKVNHNRTEPGAVELTPEERAELQRYCTTEAARCYANNIDFRLRGLIEDATEWARSYNFWCVLAGKLQ